MITKTRRRFMLTMMLVTAIIIVAALVTVYLLTYNSQETNNQQRLNSFEEVSISANGTVSFNGESADAYIVERTFIDIGTSFSMLVDDNGQIIYNLTTEEGQTQEMLQTAADIAWQGENYSKVELEGRIWQYSVSPAVTRISTEQQNEKNDKTYQIRFIDITESQQTLRTLAITLSAVGVLLLAFFFFFSLFFSKRAIRPLVEVMQKQRQFIADASHELKTPVSIIKANCSVLYANEESTILSQREWLDSIVTGADRMTDLIYGLIKLVKIEASDNVVIKSEVSLDKAIEENLDMLDLMIKEKSLNVEVSNCAEKIWSDSNRVSQAFNIVLDNAIKYANDGGIIKIAITQEKKWICLSVFNTGDGIEKECLDKIFDRFYRAEGARTQDGSFGLGLSIAYTIMRQLGGAIIAESVVGESATFKLRFPKNKITNKGTK